MQEIAGKVWISIPSRMKDKSQLALHRNCFSIGKKFAENRREICVFYLSNIYFLFEMWRAVFDVFYVMLFSGCYSHNKTMNAAD